MMGPCAGQTLRLVSGSENATMTWCSSMLTDEKYRCASLKNVSLRTRLSAGLFTQPKSLQNVVYFFFFLNHNDFGVLVEVFCCGFVFLGRRRFFVFVLIFWAFFVGFWVC